MWSVRIQENTEQNKSEYGHFLRSDIIRKMKEKYNPAYELFVSIKIIIFSNLPSMILRNCSFQAFYYTVIV